MCAEIQSLLGMVRHGMGSFLVFVGLDGSKEELGIVSTNFWMYKDNDLDSLYVFWYFMLCLYFLGCILFDGDNY